MVSSDDLEAVLDVAGQEEERAWFAGDRLAAENEIRLALEDVKEFVFTVMDVRWSARAGHAQVLHEPERTAGLGTRRLNRHQVAERPDRLAFFRVECDRLCHTNILRALALLGCASMQQAMIAHARCIGSAEVEEIA